VNKSNKPLSGYRGIFIIQAENLCCQFAIAQEAYNRHALTGDYLEGIDSAAKLLFDTANEVCRTVFGVPHIPQDYCPKIDKPTFGEVAHRFNTVYAQLSKIADSDEACTRAWLFELLRRLAFLLGSVDWLVGESDPELDQLEESPPLIAKAGHADFSHRLSPVGFERGTLGLVDTVSMTTNKAVAVLTMLSNTFAIDADENRPGDDSIYYALQAVLHELLDVGAVVEAFHRNMAK